VDPLRRRPAAVVRLHVRALPQKSVSSKRRRKRSKPARSFSAHPERCGGMSGSPISFSLHEIMRTQGQPARSVSG